MNQQNLAGFIWPMADFLRGGFEQPAFSSGILPFALMRRLPRVSGTTRQVILNRYAKLKAVSMEHDTKPSGGFGSSLLQHVPPLTGQIKITFNGFSG